jgi:protein pelota
VKEHFKEYLSSKGLKGMPPIVVEGTNSIGIPGAKEILYNGVISKALSELKIETETKLVEDFIAHVAKGDGLAAYGEKEVEKAAQYGAIQNLLITDKKLREGTDEQRRRMDQLIRESEKTRAVFNVVSTDHPAGDQLQHLGGIAAILRFRPNWAID